MLSAENLIAYFSELPKESKEEIYRQFYVAYFSAEEDSDQARHYHSLLEYLKKSFELSDADVAVLEAQATRRHALVQEFLNLCAGPFKERFRLN